MDHRLLTSSTLKTTSGFEDVVEQFESCLCDTNIHFDSFVDQFLAFPGLLPRIISSMTVAGFNRFWACLKIGGLFNDSIGGRILIFLEAYFAELNHPGIGELAPRVTSGSYDNVKLRLKACLDILRERRMAKHVNDYHLSSMISNGAEESEEVDGYVETYGSIQETLSHKKNAVILDAIDDHGPWKLNVSTRFIDNMGKSKSRPKLFAKIKTTLRELSYGNFSTCSQTLLTVNAPVSIYSAFLNKYCSMVYYLPGANTLPPSQEISVFGIYAVDTLEEHSFWESVGHQLSVKDSSNGHSPQILASLLSALKPDVADEIRSLVVLKQFVEYSQPVLESIQANEEIMVMYGMSPQEQAVIDHNESCYILGRSGTGKTTIMLFKMIGIESSWRYLRDEGGTLKPRQLFITRSQHLADKVKEEFARLHKTHVSGGSTASGDVGTPDVLGWDSVKALPTKFSALEECHFPVFVSFDKLCSMLEADLTLQTYSSTGSQSTQRSFDRQLLTYKMFLNQYWSEFPENLISGQDPFLVYGEIIGVIQGSEEALASGQQCLDRATYLTCARLGCSDNHSLDMFHRVYDIYEHYKTRRTELRHCDIAQRTHVILQAFNTQRPRLLKTIDFLYVDEVQDNLLADIVVMKMLCRTSSGLILAGDTAQTIFAGNAFTFNTLRSFLYRLEEKGAFSWRSQKVPEFFKLSTNYRSRGGIVACGQTVLDLITRFWPTAIDQTPKELNLGGGTRPYFFSNRCDVELQTLVSKSNESIQFGSEQCILVRDDAVRDALKPTLPDSTMILTLYESKGLEFNDVLLFNFFKDSFCSAAQWDTILRALHDDFQYHPADAILTELRFIYVAITRAKNRLWIVDQSDSGRALQTLWQRKGEIETSENLDLSKFATASGTDSWARRGREFLAERRYLLANQAFRMARLFHDAAVAEAFYFEGQVDAVHPRMRQQALCDAAQAFERVAKTSDTPEKRIEYFTTSSRLFSDIPDIPRAANCLVNAQSFTKAAILYKDEGMFDEALGVVREHAPHVDVLVKGEIVFASKLYYFQQLRIRDGMNLWEAEASSDGALFTEIYGLKQAQAAVLHYESRDAAAAELYLQVHQPSMTLDLCQNGAPTPPVESVIKALWRELKVSLLETRIPQQSSQILQDLIALTHLYAGNDTEWYSLEEQMLPYTELNLLQTIACGDMTRLRRMQSDLSDLTPSNPVLTVILSHYLLMGPIVNNKEEPSLAEISDRLDIVYTHALAIRALAKQDSRDLCRDLHVQRLFGFIPISPNSYRLRQNGHAASLLFKQKSTPHTSKQSRTVEVKRLGNALTRCLSGRLRDVVGNTLGDYSTIDQNFVASSSAKARAVLRVLLLLVLIQDTVRNVGLDGTQNEKKMVWIERFYTFFKQSGDHLTEGLASTVRQIPEGGLAFQILRGWMADIVRNVSQIATEALPSLFIKLAYLSSLLSQDDSIEHLTRMRSLGLHAPLTWVLIYPRTGPTRQRRAHYIVNDLLDAFQASKPWALYSAMQYLGHTLDQRLPIDVWVLCDYIDYIVGGLSVALAETPVDLVLPKSTALLVLQKLNGLRDQDMFVLDRFLRLIRTVLLLMLLPDEKTCLCVEGQPMQKASSQRTEAVMRVCQSLGILGYNIHDPLLRQKLVEVIIVLTHPGADSRVDHKVYTRFRNATSWMQLVATTMSSASVVRIISKPRRDGTDRYHLSHSGWSSSNSSQKKDHDGEPEELSGAESAMKSEFRLLCSILDDSPFYEHSPTDLILAGRLAEALESPLPGIAELAAGRRIRTFVRRSRTARAALGPVARHFVSCTTDCPQLTRFSRRQRVLFLGPLPHALACLDALATYFGFRKAQLAAVLQKAAHGDLETTGTAVARAHDLVQKTTELQDALRPTSTLYLGSGWQLAFRRHIEEVGELIQNVADTDIRKEFDPDWALVSKSVLYTGRETFMR